MTLTADGPLAGRVALVTGAGSGLGREISLALGRAGAALVLVGRSAEPLESVRQEAERLRISARSLPCDVSDAGQVARLVDQLGDVFVDLLVNNAGIGGPVADLVDIEPDQWDQVFDVNVRGTYLPCKAFLPRMIAEGRGDIVNLASVTGKRPLRGRTPYAASKMAILGLTATLAFEVGQHGVRVNTLSPGPVRGPRMSRNFALEAERSGTTLAQAEDEFVSRGALHRLIDEHEVGAAVVAMLQIPAMTGADIDLSAGMIAR